MYKKADEKKLKCIARMMAEGPFSKVFEEEIGHEMAETDILEISEYLAAETEEGADGKTYLKSIDKCKKALYCALIAYLDGYCASELQVMPNVMRLMQAADYGDFEEDFNMKTPLDKIFDEVKETDKDSFAVKAYNTFKFFPFPERMRALGEAQTDLLSVIASSSRTLIEKEITLETLKRNGLSLRRASYELRANREIVLEAVKQNALALEYAVDELRTDREFVLEAMKQNGEVLAYAPDELRTDREFVLEAVKQNWKALEYASEELRADKEVVLEALKQNGWALYYASDGLRADKEVVLEAVKRDGYVLRYASDELRADKEVVLEAVKQDGRAIRYASKELRGDKEFREELRSNPNNSSHD